MRVRGATACLLFLALLVLSSPPEAAADWWEDLDRGKAAPLDDIILRPSKHKNQRITFFCVFRQRDEIFAPLAAPFQPQKHENIAVWIDGAPVWEKGAYTEDYPFLYIPKAHAQHAELMQLEEFTRLEVTGRIKGAIRARPCIEILSFRKTGQRLGRTVVQSMMAGDRYSELGELELAYENYRRALTPDLPPTYDLYVRRRLSDALRRLGRVDEARRIDGGDILGGTGAPEPQAPPPGGRLGDPLPGTPGAPSPGVAPPPVTNELPGQPVGPGPLTEDLPGQPADAPSPFPPAAPPGAVPNPAPAGPPPAITSDLPGSPAPAGPPPAITSDLPGTPAPDPAPLPIVEDVPEEEDDDEQEEAEETPAPPPLAEKPPLPPGAPPRRTPRLTGVK